MAFTVFSRRILNIESTPKRGFIETTVVIAEPDNRVDFNPPHTLVAGVLHAGWTHLRAATDGGLGPHDHGPAYELCLIVDGAVDWWVEGEVHEVRSGDVFITRPHERHGGVDAMLQPSELYWVGFTLADDPPTADLPPIEARRLRRAFASMDARRFPADQGLAISFQRLLDAMRQRTGLAPSAARAAFVQLLLDTLRCHETAMQRHREVSVDIRQAMDWMRARLGEDFAIEDAAHAADLSVTRFHERFRAEVGLPPGEWRARQRVLRAKAMLRHRPDRSVTDIAMRCGFSTSQYFATTFKRLVGQTPSAYRAALRD